MLLYEAQAAASFKFNNDLSLPSIPLISSFARYKLARALPHPIIIYQLEVLGLVNSSLSTTSDIAHQPLELPHLLDHHHHNRKHVASPRLVRRPGRARAQEDDGLHQAGSLGEGPRDQDQGRRGVRDREDEARAPGDGRHRRQLRQEVQAGHHVAADHAVHRGQQDPPQGPGRPPGAARRHLRVRRVEARRPLGQGQEEVRRDAQEPGARGLLLAQRARAERACPQGGLRPCPDGDREGGQGVQGECWQRGQGDA